LGDRQSSHPVKTLLQYYGKSLEALPGVAYPGFRDNCSTLNTKTGFFLKMWTFDTLYTAFSWILEALSFLKILSFNINVGNGWLHNVQRKNCHMLILCCF